MSENKQSSHGSTQFGIPLSLDGNSSPRTPPTQHCSTRDEILKYSPPTSSFKVGDLKIASYERGYERKSGVSQEIECQKNPPVGEEEDVRDLYLAPSMNVKIEDSENTSTMEMWQNMAIEVALGMRRYASEDPSSEDGKEAIEVAQNAVNNIDYSKDYPGTEAETVEEFLNIQLQNTLNKMEEAATASLGIYQNQKVEYVKPSQGVENQEGFQTVENPSDHRMRIKGQKNGQSIGVAVIERAGTAPTTSGRKTARASNIKEVSDLSPTINNSENGILQSDTPKEEGVVPSTSTDILAPHITRDEAKLAYHNLFLIYNGKSPSICNTNTEVALRQTEILLNISELYGSTPLLQTSLNNALLQHGRSLYQAIKRDPPRWLFISCLLKCAPILREAVIHIVGSHPHWPWPTVPGFKLPGPVLDLIEDKIEELNKLKVHINGLLFMSSICVDGEDVMFARGNRETFRTAYQVVHIWHDWFRSSLREARLAGSQKRAVDAVMYRKMAHGGDVYLPSADIIDMLKGEAKNPLEVGDQIEVKQDLEIMKQYAMKVVQPLVENESMLELEKEGIDYLTCTRVQGAELPWAIRQGD